MAQAGAAVTTYHLPLTTYYLLFTQLEIQSRKAGEVSSAAVEAAGAGAAATVGVVSVGAATAVETVGLGAAAAVGAAVVTMAGTASVVKDASRKLEQSATWKDGKSSGRVLVKAALVDPAVEVPAAGTSAMPAPGRMAIRKRSISTSKLLRGSLPQRPVKPVHRTRTPHGDTTLAAKESEATHFLIYLNDQVGRW